MKDSREELGGKEEGVAEAPPRITLIVAASENNVIGRDGDLPWRLSGDLKRFKRLTMDHCLIMGRKTYESIGRPLPGRVSIVLTRSPSGETKSLSPSGGGARGGGTLSASEPNYVPPSAHQTSPNPSLPGRGASLLYAHSIEEALSLVLTTDMSHDQAFVTGGGEVYRLALPLAHRVYLTRVHTTVDGDATFPELNPSEWKLVEAEGCPADDKNEYAVTHEVWERV